MGFYLETGTNKNKAAEIIKQFGAIETTRDEAKKFVNDKDLAVVIVVEMAMWDAAGFAFSMDEFDAFTVPNDARYKRFLLVDRKIVEERTGYSR